MKYIVDLYVYMFNVYCLMFFYQDISPDSTAKLSNRIFHHINIFYLIRSHYFLISNYEAKRSGEFGFYQFCITILNVNRTLVSPLIYSNWIYIGIFMRILESTLIGSLFIVEIKWMQTFGHISSNVNVWSKWIQLQDSGNINCKNGNVQS